MNVLALDLGTHTGWALCENGRIESGTEHFPLARGESPGMRYVAFNRWLAKIATERTKEYRLDLIVYEQSFIPKLSNAYTAEFTHGLTTRVQELAATYTIRVATVHQATLKKWTAGTGRASKEMMREAVLRRWKILPVLGDKPAMDDNEIDALALLHYAQEQFGTVTLAEADRMRGEGA